MSRSLTESGDQVAGAGVGVDRAGNGRQEDGVAVAEGSRRVDRQAKRLNRDVDGVDGAQAEHPAQDLGRHCRAEAGDVLVPGPGLERLRVDQEAVEVENDGLDEILAHGRW
jgi:hypothetical protein